MRQQVERWRSQQLSAQAAKLTIYGAFVEGDLDVPKHLAPEECTNSISILSMRNSNPERCGACPMPSRLRSRNWNLYLNIRRLQNRRTHLRLAENERHARCCLIARGFKLSDRSVTLAGGFLQPFSVHNFHDSVSVTDHSGFVQDSGSNGHAGASSPEHTRKKFVGERQNSTADSILAHQQPARQTLLNLVKAIAHSNL